MVLLIRADGSLRKGMGHIWNSLAIAKEMQNRGRAVHFVLQDTEDKTPSAETIIRAGFPFSLIDPTKGLSGEVSEIQQLAANYSAQTVFIDAYPFRSGFVNALRSQGLKVGVSAFFNNLPQTADYVLNYFVGLNKTEEKHRFLGANFFPLREEFYRENPRNAIKKVLICAGGADRHGLNLVSLEAMAEVEPPLDITLVKGPATTYNVPEDLKAKVQRRHNLTVLEKTDEMAQLTNGMGLALIAAGNLSYEMAAAGVPALYLCQVPHQIKTALAWEEKGAGISQGYRSGRMSPRKVYRSIKRLLENPSIAQQMSQRAIDAQVGVSFSTAMDDLAQMCR